MNNGRDCPHGRQVGKCDTCDLITTELELEKAIAERDALAAQVEALKKEFQDARRTLQVIASCGADSTDAEIVDVVLDESRRWVSRYDESVLKLTPQQHLAEIRAQAGRDGYLQALIDYRVDFDIEFSLTESEEISAADEYAAIVRMEGGSDEYQKTRMDR